jgi:RNA polymerase sigma factor (sigma-70 family)
VTDQEIVEGISRKDNGTFLFLYHKYQEQILRMVQKNSGNAEDARDIFQEGLLALWTNITSGKFQLQANTRISTYLYALCRNIWISRLRKRKETQSIDQNPGLEIADEVNDLETHYEQVRTLEKHFGQLGDACKKILTMVYFKKTSMKTVAAEMGITEKTAKNNKYRCMQRLRAFYKTETQAS